MEEVEWKTVQYLKSSEEGPVENHTWEYELILPRPLADWDVFAVWEKERIHSMRDELKQGDILFDIGAETGWCSIIYASFVGPENLVLMESSAAFWPNIRQTWERNYGDVRPKHCYCGLLGSRTTDTRGSRKLRGWPLESTGELTRDAGQYRYIHRDLGRGVPMISIDEYVARTGIIPNALTMDVEGAEIEVIKGAVRTLKENRPKVWISVHPDLIERDYNATDQDVYRFMAECGYFHETLAVDHEVHTICLPK